MKAILISLSIALNALLVTLLLSPSNKAEAAKTTSRKQVLTRTVIEEVNLPVVTNLVQETAEPFHWSSIQSTNYASYAESLRSIGCPPQTIRDIITGEIDDWFLEERRKLFAPHAHRFWEYAAKGEFDVPSELKEPLGLLRKTREELIASAFKNISEVPAEPRRRRAENSLTWLPKEKQEAIKSLDAKYVALQKEITSNKTLQGKERNEQIRELEKEKEREKQSLMSPEELAEYKIRRESGKFHNLYGFDTNPEEMRKIAEVYARYSTGGNDSEYWRTDPEYTSDKDALAQQAKQRDAELKALLGEERFAALQRGSDHNYRQVYQLTSAYNLPASTAEKILEIQSTATAKLKEIRTDNSLSAEQRDVLVEQLQDTFGDEAEQILGPQAAKAYLRIQRLR